MRTIEDRIEAAYRAGVLDGRREALAEWQYGAIARTAPRYKLIDEPGHSPKVVPLRRR